MLIDYNTPDKITDFVITVGDGLVQYGFHLFWLIWKLFWLSILGNVSLSITFNKKFG